MRFSICLIEPEGYKYSHFLYDFCKYLCFTIEANGYDCCMVKNKYYTDRVNVIMGSHNLKDPSSVEQIKQAGKYVVVQSEVLREGGIAGWQDQKSFNSIYIPLMREAAAVWDGIESNQIHFQKLGIHAQRFPRFGYLPELEEVIHKKRKDIDFLYYGSVTPHRAKLIEELKALGGKVVCIFDEAAIFRNDYIARTRVHLAPNQTTGINHINSRVLYLLNNHAVVVAERCRDQEWIEHCFPFSDADGWANLCMETLRRPDLDQCAEEYFEHYKKLSMVKLFQPLLDQLQMGQQASPEIKMSILSDVQKPSEDVVAGYDPLLPRFKQEKTIADLTSIIILTHNRLDYTKKCIKSIQKNTPEPHEIIFVDNASTDSTIKWLQGQIKENKNYHLIENNENVGVAKGRNQGINLSKGEFILLLDNDVVVSEGWLSGLLDCLNQAPDAGIVGPMTNNISGPQQINDDSYRSVDYLDKYAAQFREKYLHRRIPFRRIVGFCMLFKRALAEQIGMLDESFGTGNFEDDDFCLRAALDGYKNYIAGDIFIHHYGSRSFIGNKINYGAAISDNRKIIDKKWTLNTASSEGRKLAVLRATELADDFYAKGKIDQAVDALINCIKYAPNNPQIYYELTSFFVESKRFSEAWEVVGTMPEAAKNHMKGVEYAGYAKEGLGLDDEATAYADKMLSHNEYYPAALNLQAILAYKKGAKEKAAEYLRKAIDTDPGYGEAYTNLGVLCWGMEKKDEALLYLKKGFVLSPTLPDANSLYYSVVSSLGVFNDAEADFREASTLYPNHKNLAFLFIDLLIQQGKFDLAILKIEDALALFGLDDGILKAALAVREKIGPLSIDKNKKNTLSLCMIVKNEEKHLVRCLRSVRDVVDEIIIVDTGSTDKTKDIATVFGAKLFNFPWTGDFSAARNESLKYATGDWILVLDADEVISSRDYDELKKLIGKSTSKPAAYAIVTRNYMSNVSVIGWTPKDGQYPEEAGAGWVPSSKVRLVPRRKDVFFSNPVHELLEYSLITAKVPVSSCKIIVHHYGKLDMERDAQKGEDYYLLGKLKYESDPTNVKYIYELAKQAHLLKKYEESVALWLKLLSLIETAPQSPDYQIIAQISQGEPLPEIYIQLASAYLLLNRYDEALKTAQRAMEARVKQKEYVHIYAHCEIIAGSLEKAFSALEELLKTKPDYLPALMLTAIIFCLEGKNEKAQELFQLLRQKHVQITTNLNEYAEQLHTNGKKDEALMILNAAIENKMSNAETMKLLEEFQKD